MGNQFFWSVRVGVYGIHPKMYWVDDSMDYMYSKNGWQIDSFVPWRVRLWGVCNTPLHRYTKNESLRVGSFNGESIFWSVMVGAYCIHPSTYRADDSIDKRELNFWSVRVWAYCIRPETYRVSDSMDKMESNFWSVRVGAYCMQPQTYRVFDSMDKGESNFWSVRVGAYCMQPQTYRVFDSMDYVYSKNGWKIDSFVPWRGRLWGVCNTPLYRYTENGSFRVRDFNGESNFWRV